MSGKEKSISEEGNGDIKQTTISERELNIERVSDSLCHYFLLLFFIFLGLISILSPRLLFLHL